MSHIDVRQALRTTTRDRKHRPRARLIEALHGAHGALKVERTNVLPALLEETNEGVDGEGDVGVELLTSEVDVADGGTHAENLLELELDGVGNLLDLLLEGLLVGDRGGELTLFVELGAEDTGDLTNERVRGDEGIVLVSPLLDELLVL